MRKSLRFPGDRPAFPRSAPGATLTSPSTAPNLERPQESAIPGLRDIKDVGVPHAKVIRSNNPWFDRGAIEAGNVQLPRIVEATHPEFGYAAVQTVATWWFEQPLRNGNPGTVRVRMPAYFDLKEPAPK